MLKIKYKLWKINLRFVTIDIKWKTKKQDLHWKSVKNRKLNLVKINYYIRKNRNYTKIWELKKFRYEKLRIALRKSRKWYQKLGNKN